MEKRKSARVRCRFGCEVARGAERAEGTVLDISEGGLSVQTRLEVDQGDALAVRFHHPLEGDLALETIVWHARKTRHRQTGKVRSFLGLVLSKAPQAYYELLPGARSTTPPSVAPPVETTEPPLEDEASHLGPFRIRMKARSGPRTRVLSLSAESADEARELALAELGDDWDVLEVHEA
jgi:hypothetical protein